MSSKFVLTDSEAELLVHFEEHQKLGPLARSLGRDITVISKQLKRIAEKADLLTKVSGRWTLTEKGKSFNQLTRDYLLSQEATLSRVHLRIGTNREFGARILGRYIKELQSILGPVVLTIHVYESGIEAALLNGEIDLGLDCGKPFSPEVVYKTITPEIVLPVASPAFAEKYGLLNCKKPSLSELPHIYFYRQKPDRIMGSEYSDLTVAISTNDVATAREICIQGVGWALLPRYAIAVELEKKQLIPLGVKQHSVDSYGVWYLRSRKLIAPLVKKTSDWFRSILPNTLM